MTALAKYDAARRAEIIKAWGFEPSTIAFDWIKQTPSGDGLHWGMGYYTRAMQNIACSPPKAHRHASRPMSTKWC